MYEPVLGSYRVGLSGEWTLADLHTFSRTYSQLYMFQYSLKFQDWLTPPAEPEFGDWIRDPYTVNPWVGGWDAVNFYRQLEKRVPPPHHPTLASMHYASPGWIELNLEATVAVAIHIAVYAFITNAMRLNRLYNEIYKGMREREIMKIKVKRQQLKLDKETEEFIDKSNRVLSSELQLEHREQLNRLTENPLTTLRLLLSYHRRNKKLSKYETTGKTKI